jgi:hypothetical protein
MARLLERQCAIANGIARVRSTDSAAFYGGYTAAVGSVECSPPYSRSVDHCELLPRPDACRILMQNHRPGLAIRLARRPTAVDRGNVVCVGCFERDRAADAPTEPPVANVIAGMQLSGALTMKALSDLRQVTNAAYSRVPGTLATGVISWFAP